MAMLVFFLPECVICMQVGLRWCWQAQLKEIISIVYQNQNIENRMFFLWVAEIWPSLNDSICVIWKHLSDLDHLLLFLAVSPAAVNTKKETDSFEELWIICACACTCTCTWI